MARLRDMAAAVVTATALIGCTTVIGDFTAGAPESSDAGSSDGNVPPLDATMPNDAGNDSADAAAPPVDATVSDAPFDAPRQDSATGDSGWDAPSAPDAPVDAPADAAADVSMPTDAALDASSDANDASSVDAGTDSSSDAPHPVDAGPDGFDATPPVDAGWFPTAVPSVVLWLAANQGVVMDAGLVSTWLDQTTHQNDAKALGPDGSVPTLGGSVNPIYLPNAVNGHPALHFDNSTSDPDSGVYGSCLRIRDNPTVQFGTGDFLIEMVIRTLGPTPFSVAYEKQGNYGVGVGMFTNWGGPDAATWAVQLASAGPNIVATPINASNVWTLYAVQRTGTSVTVRINGAANASVNLTNACNDAGCGDAGAMDLSAPGSDVNLGAQYYTGEIFRSVSDIAEVVVSNGTISSPDLTTLEGYLRAKYALP